MKYTAWKRKPSGVYYFFNFMNSDCKSRGPREKQQYDFKTSKLIKINLMCAQKRPRKLFSPAREKFVRGGSGTSDCMIIIVRDHISFHDLIFYHLSRGPDPLCRFFFPTSRHQVSILPSNAIMIVLNGGVKNISIFLFYLIFMFLLDFYAIEVFSILLLLLLNLT